jgi:purine-nucleoside phosphorylase
VNQAHYIEAMNEHQLIKETFGFLRSRFTGSVPKIGIVLGSGLGGFAERVQSDWMIPTSAIPNWPVSTVEGHAGNLIVGSIGEAPVIVLQGRVHYYEGYPIRRVVFSIRVLARLGVRHLLLTNAAGGMNPKLSPGDLMLVTDHLNLMGVNPLIGETDSGPRFPDLSNAYDSEWRMEALRCAKGLGVPLKQGVLVATSGPSYETPAEIRMIRKLGGDAVTMSTIPETIAAAHSGLRVVALSTITNMAAGIGKARLDHGDVQKAASEDQSRLVPLLRGLVETIHRFDSRSK